MYAWHKRLLLSTKRLRALQAGKKLLFEFLRTLFLYSKGKVVSAGILFERHKNVFVRFLLMKRGRYNRPFLHLSAMAVMGVGVIIGPFLAETYPVFSSDTPSLLGNASRNVSEQSIAVDEDVLQTSVSQKPRDEVITYRVEKGDTLSTIAKKFGISVDTIKWINNLTSDNLTVEDELKILPVTGVLHKVAKGDTVYTIAKKYDTEAQKIADFPFNEFANPETFSLVAGQLLIVPDGVRPSQRPPARKAVYLAQGPVKVSGGGFTWPVSGIVSQFAAWYHMAIDITSSVGTPVVAAQSGTVVKAVSGVWDGGYGTSVVVDNGGGFQTLYAHLSGLNVSAGDEVAAGGTVLGWIGMTGRTTGPHVHFEIRKNGTLVNPLPYLQ